MKVDFSGVPPSERPARGARGWGGGGGRAQIEVDFSMVPSINTQRWVCTFQILT